MYSIRECLQLVGILHSVSDSNLEEKVLNIFEKVGHRLKRPADKQKKWNDNSEFFSPKGLPKCTSRKERVEKVGLERNWFSRGQLFIVNQSLCTHHGLLWPKAKCLYLVFVYITKVALQECLIFEILIGEKSCTFISLCRSPSQSSDSLVEFSDSLQLSLDKINNQNPFLTIVLGDFNTKSSDWCKQNQTTCEGFKIYAITSQFDLQQLIQPTHILGKSSSYIDLIFTFHPSLVMGCGAHPSLHSNFHYQKTCQI